MRVQVELVCAPHPVASIEHSLRAAGKSLTSRADSVQVEVRQGERPVAILEFEMRRVAQYKVVDEIYKTVRFWASSFYEDITIGFPKG